MYLVEVNTLLLCEKSGIFFIFKKSAQFRQTIALRAGERLGGENGLELKVCNKNQQLWTSSCHIPDHQGGGE
jgi:hypothetical protein